MIPLSERYVEGIEDAPHQDLHHQVQDKQRSRTSPRSPRIQCSGRGRLQQRRNYYNIRRQHAHRQQCKPPTHEQLASEDGDSVHRPAIHPTSHAPRSHSTNCVPSDDATGSVSCKLASVASPSPSAMSTTDHNPSLITIHRTTGSVTRKSQTQWRPRTTWTPRSMIPPQQWCALCVTAHSKQQDPTCSRRTRPSAAGVQLGKVLQQLEQVLQLRVRPAKLAHQRNL
jgi:hypothetical protein